jgi:hypothetical protein
MIFVQWRGSTVWHIATKRRSTVCGLGKVPVASNADVTRSTKAPPEWRICKSCLRMKDADTMDLE